MKTVTYVNPGYNPLIKYLYVNSNATDGVASHIYQAQDKLTATNVQIGADGWEAFEQVGGEHTVTGNLYLGHLSGSGGVYELALNGNLSTGNTYVGNGERIASLPPPVTASKVRIRRAASE